MNLKETLINDFLFASLVFLVGFVFGRVYQQPSSLMIPISAFLVFVLILAFFLRMMIIGVKP